MIFIVTLPHTPKLNIDYLISFAKAEFPSYNITTPIQIHDIHEASIVVEKSRSLYATISITYNFKKQHTIVNIEVPESDGNRPVSHIFMRELSEFGKQIRDSLITHIKNSFGYTDDQICLKTSYK